MDDQPIQSAREARCQCCGGFAGHGADPDYCGICRAAGEHLTTCPMCRERVPRASIDDVCPDCEETMDELDRLVRSGASAADEE
ncbi:hypothetical protein [Halopelagius fulvigenes]|uniref:Uncharacterized protein n=1 Tax=Halopelagius fulvigenes TaxID=1198324 RepID=A0ABD5U1W1_9EURY